MNCKLPYITVIECAQLCSHIYHPWKKLFGGKVNKLTRKNVTTLKQLSKSKPTIWSRVADIDYGIRCSDIISHPLRIDYQLSIDFGLYIKVSQGQPTDAVMVIRGTATMLNLITDADCWWHSAHADISKNKLPSVYINAANSFYRSCQHYLQQLAAVWPTSHIAKLHISGHSLGGAIAKLMTAHSYIVPTGATIVFNAPGIADMPAVDNSYGPILHDVNARYGVINKIGKALPLEDICYIDVDPTKSEPRAKWIQQHFKPEDYKNSQDFIEKLELLCQNAPCIGIENYSLLYCSEKDIAMIVNGQHSIVNIISALETATYQPLATTRITPNMQLSNYSSSIH